MGETLTTRPRNMDPFFPLLLLRPRSWTLVWLAARASGFLLSVAIVAAVSLAMLMVFAWLPLWYAVVTAAGEDELALLARVREWGARPLLTAIVCGGVGYALVVALAKGTRARLLEHSELIARESRYSLKQELEIAQRPASETRRQRRDRLRGSRDRLQVSPVLRLGQYAFGLLAIVLGALVGAAFTEPLGFPWEPHSLVARVLLTVVLLFEVALCIGAVALLLWVLVSMLTGLSLMERWIVRRTVLPVLSIAPDDVTPIETPLPDDVASGSLAGRIEGALGDSGVDRGERANVCCALLLGVGRRAPTEARTRSSAESRSVPLRQLSAGLFVATFWRLQQEGLIELEGARVIRRRWTATFGLEGASSTCRLLDLDVDADRDTTRNCPDRSVKYAKRGHRSGCVESAQTVLVCHVDPDPRSQSP